MNTVDAAEAVEASEVEVVLIVFLLGTWDSLFDSDRKVGGRARENSIDTGRSSRRRVCGSIVELDEEGDDEGESDSLLLELLLLSGEGGVDPLAKKECELLRATVSCCTGGARNSAALLSSSRLARSPLKMLNLPKDLPE